MNRQLDTPGSGGNLLSRPFCGDPARLKPTSAFTARGVRVQCTACGASTNPVFEGGVTRADITKPYTMAEATRKTIAKWNARAVAI